MFMLGQGSQGSVPDFYPDKQALKVVKIALKERNISLDKRVEHTSIVEKNEPIVLYRLNRINGEKFYVVFTQASGRYEKFDYLVAVNSDFEVEKIRILKYRSEHGGEIASKKWLKQFEHYSSGELRYRKEISALSGATISAGALTNDIPKVLRILKNSCGNM